MSVSGCLEFCDCPVAFGLVIILLDLSASLGERRRWGHGFAAKAWYAVLPDYETPNYSELNCQGGRRPLMVIVEFGVVPRHMMTGRPLTSLY